MTAAFWWGLATIPIFVGMCALAAACIIGLWWALAAWGGDDWKMWGTYEKASIAATVAVSKSVHRILYIPGFYFIRVNRGGLGKKQHDPEYLRHVSRIAAAIRREQEDPNGKSRWEV